MFQKNQSFYRLAAQQSVRQVNFHSEVARAGDAQESEKKIWQHVGSWRKLVPALRRWLGHEEEALKQITSAKRVAFVKGLRNLLPYRVEDVKQLRISSNPESTSLPASESESKSVATGGSDKSSETQPDETPGEDAEEDADDDSESPDATETSEENDEADIPDAAQSDEGAAGDGEVENDDKATPPETDDTEESVEAPSALGENATQGETGAADKELSGNLAAALEKLWSNTEHTGVAQAPPETAESVLMALDSYIAQDEPSEEVLPSEPPAAEAPSNDSADGSTPFKEKVQQKKNKIKRGVKKLKRKLKEKVKKVHEKVQEHGGGIAGAKKAAKKKIESAREDKQAEQDVEKPKEENKEPEEAQKSVEVFMTHKSPEETLDHDDSIDTSEETPGGFEKEAEKQRNEARQAKMASAAASSPGVSERLPELNMQTMACTSGQA